MNKTIRERIERARERSARAEAVQERLRVQVHRMGDSSFHTKIRGVTFRNEDRKSRQRLIARCRVGEKLVLEREPDNCRDPNAIKVLRMSGEQLGYIPAHVAANGLAKDLDCGMRPKCRIANLTGGQGRWRGVNIEIGEWPEGSPPSEVAIQNEATALYGCIILVLAIIVVVVLVLLRLQ
jgi:hypothetical protein